MDERGPGFLRFLMNRRDIADYLGLTLETVSRALRQLDERGNSGIPSCNQRQIVLLDRVNGSPIWERSRDLAADLNDR